MSGARFLLGLVVALGSVLATACAKKTEVNFFVENFPVKLSEWRILRSSDSGFLLSPELIPYDLNSPLFSDYALKLRAFYVPPGKSVKYTDHGVFDFPVGSILVKTFYFPR